MKITNSSSHGARFDAGTSDEERYPHVELEGETLSFDQTELSQMVTVVGRVYYVRVVQLSQIFQFLVDLLTSHSDKKKKESFRGNDARMFAISLGSLFLAAPW